MTNITVAIVEAELIYVNRLIYENSPHVNRLIYFI